MTVTNSIDISTQFTGSKVEMVKMFFKNGWKPNDYGKITYLPLGDNDAFNWCSENITLNDLYRIIAKKESNNELIGIVMTWEDSMIGGQLLIYNDKSISFIATINSKYLNDYERSKILNYNWYIVKLVQPFFQLGKLIQTIKIDTIML